MTTPPNLSEWFGGIDIYLFDQLLKERIVPGSVMRSLPSMNRVMQSRRLAAWLRSSHRICLRTAFAKSRLSACHFRMGSLMSY